MADVFAGRWADALLDRNSKLITNISFNVYTDQACTNLATLYTDRTKATPVNQATLLTDELGLAEIYAAPGIYYLLLPSATAPRKIEVKEDIADTADENDVLLIANNLSDLNNIATARTNLGLGSAATHAASDFDAVNAAANALDQAKAYTNSAIAASGGGGGGAGALAAANNLSDLANASTARDNLGLGTAATEDAAAFDNSGAAASAYALAQAYTNAAVAASGSGGALIAVNNLSDLNNVATARSNLGLGSAATQAASGFDNAGAAASAQSTAQAYADANKLSITANLNDLNNISTARNNLGLGSASTMAASGFDNAGAAASAYGLAVAYTNAIVAASGGRAPNVVTKGADYAANPGEYVVMDSSAATRNLILPTPFTGAGPIYVEQAGNNTVSATGSIKGLPTSLPIGVNGGVLMFVAMGSSTWRIGSFYFPPTSIARLDQDNDFGGHILKNYGDNQNSNSTTAATAGDTNVPWGSARQATSSTGMVLTLPASAPYRGAWVVLGQGSTHQSTIQVQAGGYLVGTGGRSSPIKTFDQNSRILVECIDPTPGASGYIASGGMA